MIRTEVEVICLHKTDGKIIPMSVKWNNLSFVIQRITQCVRCASLKGGGAGIRYTCVFENSQRRYLFVDNGIWFIEKID